MRAIEMEAQVKVCRAEMEEVCARIGFIKELRDLGQSQEDIEKFLSKQFSRAEGPSNQTALEISDSEDSLCEDEVELDL